MIVRIQAEGQYRLDSRWLDSLNGIDNQLVQLVGDGDDALFRQLFGEMLTLVRDKGEALPPDALDTSDVVLPDPSSDLAEIKSLFIGDGVIPG